MPVDAFTKGVRRWRSWQGLADTETLLLSRQRGRFMTTWFGASFEIHGLAPVVHVDNLGAVHAALRGLDAQRQAAVGRPERASLLEPLLGAGGVLVGVMSSPVTALMLGIAGWSKHQYWWHWLGPVIWLLTGPLAALLGPVAILAVLGGKVLRGEHDLFTVFQVLAEISSPLQQIFGMLSWFVSRVVPVLAPLSDVVVAIAGLVRTTVGLLGGIVAQLAGLGAVFRQPLVIVGAGFGAMAAGLRHAFGRLRELGDIGTGAFEQFRREVAEFGQDFDPTFVVKRHPLVVALGTLSSSTSVLVARWMELITLLPLWIGDLIVKAVKDDPDDEKPPEGWWAKKKAAAKDWAWEKFKDLSGMPDAPPSLTEIPRLPSTVPFSEALAESLKPTAETEAIA
ncbi:MAG: hypothetical protein H0U21_16185, partial [Acidimicrobiia bacterium]|nr:hypothetical protein [Acidimicrobiia bacterium]